MFPGWNVGPCGKRNDYAEEASSNSIAEVIEGKLWAMYLAGLISRISAKELLLILERLRILESCGASLK